MKGDLEELNQQVIDCFQCERLVQWREQVAQEKVKRHRAETYWGKAVPGFGPSDAELVIIGLAPAAHGANRTGRMFTGDSSGDWLYKALYEAGFATQPKSTHKEDGLQLINTFITSPVKCAPPQNKPTSQEIKTCSKWLVDELNCLPNKKVIVCLGGIGFNTFCKVIGLKGAKFSHGGIHQLEDGITLISSYHPSRQNTNTGKLKWDAWLSIFLKVRQILSVEQV